MSQANLNQLKDVPNFPLVAVETSLMTSTLPNCCTHRFNLTELDTSLVCYFVFRNVMIAISKIQAKQADKNAVCLYPIYRVVSYLTGKGTQYRKNVA